MNAEFKITKSDSLNELMAALAKAQGKIQPASKDKSNPFFKSKYADLSSVWDACRAPLSENGLSILQLPSNNENGLYLTTILGHASGQWISCEVKIPLVKNDPQTIGSALTYFRRYCLASAIGVAPEDDDGEKAQQSFRGKEISAPIPKNGDMNGIAIKDKISKEQANGLKMILKNCNEGYRKWFYNNLKSQYRIETIEDLNITIFANAKASALKQMAIDHSVHKIRDQQLVGAEIV